MWDTFRRSLKTTAELLFPQVCLHCGKGLNTDGLHLCKECISSIRPLSPGHCICCAHPFTSETSLHHCSSCLRDPPCFTKVYAAGLYEGTIKEAIQGLKYRNQLYLAKPLGQLLEEKIDNNCDDFEPDIIIPVPLHIKRLRQRNYNQALELARPLSKRTGLPVDISTLIRHRPTIPQQGLSARERKRNLRNAFSVSSAIPGQNILLIDDVITTGETVRACAKTLIDAGASEVRIAAVGRA